jgi:transposase
MRVKEALKHDPYSGHLFLFVNRVRTSCKVLYYDGTGFVILQKRLDRGTFSRVNPSFDSEVILTEAEFGLFFEGSDLNKRFIESPLDRNKMDKNKKRAFLQKRELQEAVAQI